MITLARVALCVAVVGASSAQPPAKKAKPAPRTQPDRVTAGPKAGFIRFLPAKHPGREHVLIDLKGKRVRLEGKVVLREGPPLEMLACLEHTKEHESVIAVKGQAIDINIALLATGFKPGKPVQWQPKFQPPTGTSIRVTVWWQEKGKWRHDDARHWVRQIGKPERTLPYHWVFAGSGFARNIATGNEDFLAQDGDIICLANFPSALLDVPFRSTDANADLSFEANTPRIPPEGTKVYLVLDRAPKALATQTQPARPARVLLVTEKNVYLSTTLRILETPPAGMKMQKSVETTTVKPEHLKTQAYRQTMADGRYDFVIYDRCAPAVLPTCNAMWVGAFPPHAVFAKAVPVDKPTIRSWNMQHRLLLAGRAPRSLFTGITVDKARIVSLPAGSTWLVRSDMGPLMFVWPNEGRQHLVLAFDLQHSSFVARPIFLPFVIETLRELGGAPRPSARPSGKRSD